METKAEKILKLSGIISNKAKRIKTLKIECGQQATKICVLNERTKELEERLKTWHSPENLQTACRIRDEQIKKLEENAKEDLKEIERLRGLASQLCEERNQALKGSQ